MPKYRQLHTKIIDSFDFNEMPDDFTRVTWMLLTLGLDSEGRGIDNMAWVKSKIFPLREDITEERIYTVFEWLDERGMIVRYEVGDRHYFYIPTFKTYQSGTNKEAPSLLPGPTPELLRSYSNPIESESESESVLTTPPTEFPLPDKLNTPAFLETWNEWIIYRKEIKHKMTPRTAKKQLKYLEGFGPTIGADMINVSILNGWQGIFELKQNSNGNPPQQKRTALDRYGNEVSV